MAFVGFVIYALAVQPEIFSWRWIFLLPYAVILLLFSAPLAILSAVINIKFRDFQQFIGLLLQIVWYMSPVFLPKTVFEKPGLAEISAFNPVAALMNLLRDPLLYDTTPQLNDAALVLVWTAALWLLAIITLRRNERRIVFFY